MKVVFIEDVPDVALAGETKVVADGYGRNYLLPQKLAVLADSAASHILKEQMKKVAVKRAQALEAMASLAAKINGVAITIQAKVGEKEKLYGSITSADIAGELAKAGYDVDKRKIEMHEPIKEVGSYDITIRFTHDVAADIKLTVEAEPVVEEKPEKVEKKPRARKKAAEAEAAEGEGTEAEAAVEETGDEIAEPAAQSEEPMTDIEIAAAEAEEKES